MPEMTAIQAYYHAIHTGQLPATIAFVTTDGRRGVATQQFAIRSEAQREMCFHENRLVRAKASLFALRRVHERFQTEVEV